jgi:hypothetical protein
MFHHPTAPYIKTLVAMPISEPEGFKEIRHRKEP